MDQAVEGKTAAWAEARSWDEPHSQRDQFQSERHQSASIRHEPEGTEVSYHNRQKVKTMDAARGKWHGILVAAGLSGAIVNGKHQPCPMCGGKDRFRFTNFSGNGSYICNQCGSDDGMGLLMQLKGVNFKQAADMVDSILGNKTWFEAIPTRVKERKPPCIKTLRRQWDEAKLISPGDPVDKYLTARGITIRPLQGLRYLRKCFHPGTGCEHPAMLALIKAYAPWDHCTLHKTYLTFAGEKLNVDRQRLYARGDLPEVGAVQLLPAAERMGIAEGIETALSAAQLFNMPVWATTNAAMLGKWHVPDVVKHLVIFADNDKNGTGIKAARQLFARACTPERTVDIAMPPEAGQDWNDVLTTKGREEYTCER